MPFMFYSCSLLFIIQKAIISMSWKLHEREKIMKYNQCRISLQFKLYREKNLEILEGKKKKLKNLKKSIGRKLE